MRKSKAQEVMKKSRSRIRYQVVMTKRPLVLMNHTYITRLGIWNNVPAVLAGTLGMIDYSFAIAE
jgi:hypothetical protein